MVDAPQPSPLTSPQGGPSLAGLVNAIQQNGKTLSEIYQALQALAIGEIASGTVLGNSSGATATPTAQTVGAGLSLASNELELATIANDTLLGNSSGAAAVPTGQAVGGGLALAAGALGVATNGITNSMLAQAPADTIKGNGTGATADVTDLTAADVVSLIDGQFPKVRAHQTTAQSLANATWTKITLDTVDFDTNSNFASSRFTPTIAGYYRVTGSVFFTGTSSSPIAVAVYKDGSNVSQGQGGNAIDILKTSDLIFMNGSTDYLELYAYQGSGASADTDPFSYAIYFAAERVP